MIEEWEKEFEKLHSTVDHGDLIARDLDIYWFKAAWDIQQRKIDEKQKVIKAFQNVHGGIVTNYSVVKSDLQYTEEKLQIAIEALSWYIDGDPWDMKVDCGKIAKQALQKIRGEG